MRQLPLLLPLRVALTEFDDEMRKQGVQFTTELEYWAHIDDIGRAGTVCHNQTQRDARETWPGAQKRRHMHSPFPNTGKNSQDPIGNDALREVDTEWPLDFGHGQ